MSEDEEKFCLAHMDGVGWPVNVCFLEIYPSFFVLFFLVADPDNVLHCKAFFLVNFISTISVP